MSNSEAQACRIIFCTSFWTTIFAQEWNMYQVFSGDFPKYQSWYIKVPNMVQLGAWFLTKLGFYTVKVPVFVTICTQFGTKNLVQPAFRTFVPGFFKNLGFRQELSNSVLLNKWSTKYKYQQQLQKILKKVHFGQNAKSTKSIKILKKYKYQVHQNFWKKYKSTVQKYTKVQSCTDFDNSWLRPRLESIGIDTIPLRIAYMLEHLAIWATSYRGIWLFGLLAIWKMMCK